MQAESMLRQTRRRCQLQHLRLTFGPGGLQPAVLVPRASLPSELLQQNWQIAPGHFSDLLQCLRFWRPRR